MKGGGKMKFMTLIVEPTEKIAEIGAASDKVWTNVPKGNRPEFSYVMLCVPQLDVPPNSLVAFGISEADSADEIAARTYPLMLAGATAVRTIPLLEVPVAGAAKAEKKYRG
jgi:hypothetical protein